MSFSSKAINDLITLFLLNKSDHTCRMYLRDLRDFYSYLGINNQNDALNEFLGYAASQAELTVLHYRNI